MEQSEIEVLVGEAENRVERLRSLYDQYFMGIERIEPQIARKDVERRIQILRRTQIRNTALRFRFQNVLLRYNTFAAHWMRICRQIEDGTYKHHLRKAKERFDPKVTAKEARRAAAAGETADTEPPPPGAGFELDLDVDVDFEDGVDAPDMRAALRSYALPQDVVAASVSGRALAAMKTATPAAPRQEAPLDRTTERAPPPVPSIAPAPTTHSKAAPPPLPARSAAPPLPGRPPPPPVPGASGPSGASKPAPPPLPNRPPTAMPPPLAKPAAAAPALARPGTVPMITPTGAPVRPAAAPAAGPAARPAASPVASAPPAAPSAAAAAPVARPAPAPARVSVPAKPAAAAPAANASSISDERVRQIYSQYVETKRSMKESTAAVTMESMAKSLRDSSDKLRQKHAGKAIDFEVQVKDGKTVLKPIVR